MAEKTYKYNSICEREKPIQTNSKRQFIMHMLSCPTCQEKLPREKSEDLQPELSQIMAQRAHNKELARIHTSEKIEKAPVDTDTAQPDLEEKEPAEETVPDEPDLQGQFDRHLGDSPVFQGIQKSVTETKTDVKKLTKQVDGLGDQISSQIASLGDTLTGKKSGEEAGDKEVDAGEATEVKEAPGKVLSEEEEKRQQGTRQETWGRGDSRPNPFGTPENIPAGMREGYQPGQRGGEGSGEKVSPEGKKPPEDEEPPEEEPVPKGRKGKGAPDLSSREEVEAADAWLDKQKKRMGIREKPEEEKKEKIPYVGDLTDIIREVKQAINAWKGEGGGGEAGEAISFSKFSQELVLEMIKRQVAAQIAPPPAAAGSVSIVHMDAIRNLLGTFFTGMKSMPKEEQKTLIKSLSETGSEISQTEEIGSPEQIR